VHATRRAGARHEVSKRVTLKPVATSHAGVALEGWALNMSRGGLRVILEEKVEPGDEFDIAFIDSPPATPEQRGCIVWVQEEHDGVVAGIAFKNPPAAGPNGKPGDPRDRETGDR
jgi:hypothetical protein